MMGPLRIKICGITSPADAREAVGLGADAIGFNFYHHSPRCIDTAAAVHIAREMPSQVDLVGVFVNEPLRQLHDLASGLTPIRTFQWHGEQPELGDRFPFRLIPAFSVRDRDSLDRLRGYFDRCRQVGWLPLAVLVDAHVAGQYGGTGQTAPWDLLADFRPPVPLILAGGLNPQNVADAVRLVRPDMVDVASGVESRPGHKDADKMRRFIANAREAAGR
jgi:phosphoribosylanthranilate isomerase